MMTEKYPTWLIGHVKEWAEKRLPTVILCSTTGNELLEVWYYGDLLTVKGEPQSYIIDSDEAPGLVTARDPESGEEFVIFDGGRHGYDNMFCDEHDPSRYPLLCRWASRVPVGSQSQFQLRIAPNKITAPMSTEAMYQCSCKNAVICSLFIYI